MKRIETALQFISPVERDTWVMCGMALRSEYGDAAREMWMDWSREADSFKEADARAVWKSFRGTGISIASLIHEAKQNGFKDDKAYQPPTREQIEAKQRAAAERHTQEGKARIKAAQDAAKKAEWILEQCKTECHAYLHSKGFKELMGLVWRPDEETNLLCIPMFVNKQLAGVQMIDKLGEKKYLSGAITAQAEYCFDSGAFDATDWWVEGYASGLSLRACLHALKLRYRIHVTFSANNLKRMAHSGFVVADNDASNTGAMAAAATGLPYFLAPGVGSDINDMHKAQGTFRASQAIGKWLRGLKEEQEFYAS